MSNIFEIKEHVVPGQHIREYARANSFSQDDPVYIAIKQYIPLDNPKPQPGDVTIIGAHANGFPKELYEPLWASIYQQSQQRGFRIRSIWIADVATQGQSGVINEEHMGNDPAWNDHARDLLHIINHFREQMPRPLIGLGHSMGATQLVNLSFMHPRLFTSLILLDPVILDLSANDPNQGPLPAKASSFRRDLWPNLEAARAAFAKSKFYQTWDPRVLELWLQYGLRKAPTAIYPDAKDGEVTLTTTKHQEVFCFLRPFFDNRDGLDARKEHPDIDAEFFKQYAGTFPFYRAEAPNTFMRLDTLRPPVLYIFGGASPMSQPPAQKAKVERTGIGIGGSGGAKMGRVKSVSLDGIGHLVAMQDVDGCAVPAASWISERLEEWRADEAKYIAWTKKSLREKSTLSEELLTKMKQPIGPVSLPRGKL